jgi:hypothetical protein
MWRLPFQLTKESALSFVILPIFYIALRSQNKKVWLGCLLAIAAIAFLGWIYNLKNARQIIDLPLSRIGSAAQGYVELVGQVSVAPENLTTSPINGYRCVWFRSYIYEKSGDDWQLSSQTTSSQTIQIKDSTGTCQIDPDDAMIIGATKHTSRQDNYRYVEEILYGGGNLYVLGEFSTIGGAATELNLKKDVGELLDSWKRDKKTLLQRFDLNKDGEIDMAEWNLARRAAVKEVTELHRELRADVGVHVIRAPQNHQLFLISTLSPHKLKVRFMLWAAFHLVLFLVSCLGAIFLATGHF